MDKNYRGADTYISDGIIVYGIYNKIYDRRKDFL